MPSSTSRTWPGSMPQPPSRATREQGTTMPRDCSRLSRSGVAKTRSLWGIAPGEPAAGGDANPLRGGSSPRPRSPTDPAETGTPPPADPPPSGVRGRAPRGPTAAGPPGAPSTSAQRPPALRSAGAALSEVLDGLLQPRNASWQRGTRATTFTRVDSNSWPTPRKFRGGRRLAIHSVKYTNNI